MAQLPAQQLLATAQDLQRRGLFEKARELYQQVLRHDPRSVHVLHGLGGLALQGGDAALAVEMFSTAVTVQPNVAVLHNNLGVALKASGRLDEAAASLRRAGELKPDFADAYLNLGLTSRELNRFDDAVAAFRRALEIQPNHAAAANALAMAEMERGELGAAFRLMSERVEKVKDAQAHGNLCLLSNYLPSLSGEQVLSIHRQWDADFGAGAVAQQGAATARHENDRSPERRLRIGYVSPDFRAHAVSNFVEPMLAGHDHERFEIFCYSDVAAPDSTTELFRAQSDQWRDVSRLRGEAVEKLVREDRIDILVDLAGHSAHNRLAVFARKPAPVQVSMIGYPSTTGLSAIDYKIADAYSDPPGADRFYSEKLLRLDGTFWCFRPLDDRAPAGVLPALRNGVVTFGSVNNIAKLNDSVLNLWARIVSAVPNSRIHFRHASASSEVARRRIVSAFRDAGVEESRVTLSAFGSFADYVTLIRTFDLALDPFPFNGGTTTCHLLFYGVPIVTLAGERQVSRMGVSILHAVGLDNLIALSHEDYVSRAVALAGDLPRLADLRSRVRPAMLASSLCDAFRYARRLEAAYRQAWRTWCECPT